ncbi:MAG: DUF4956 domain-containing protein [Methanoregulaceae archaeon]|nr:DUF4956 domain-containing protein [Methanoregulaceae archaeon]
MPDFLRQTFASDVNVVWTDVVLRQILALLFGSAVAGVYALTRGSGPERRSIITTLVLLTILIGTISSVIGDNVARAFSLVGALSIVRFRTVVEDTRDTAFVILAVTVGMAVGSGYLIAPLALIPTALVAAMAFGGRPDPKGTEYAVVVRTTLGVPEADILDALRHHSSRLEVHRVATARQGSAMETEYRVTLNTGPRDLHDRLSTLPGVVGVEIQLS